MTKRRQFGSVRQLKSGKYQARALDPLTRKSVALGVFARKADATKRLAIAEADQARGAWIDPKGGAITFEAYSAQWLAGWVGAPTTRTLYEGLIRNHLLPEFGPAQLSRITPKVVRSWHSAQRTIPKPKPVTLAKAYRLLSNILGTAVEDELILRNPCQIKGASVEYSPERPVLSVVEVYQVADTVDLRWRALVLFAAFSGLRLAEMQGLRMKNLNLLAGTVTVEGGVQECKGGFREVPPKTTAGYRTLALPANLVAELKAHTEVYSGTGPEGLVFCNAEGTYFRRNTMRRSFKKALATCNLNPDVRIHDLRHTGHTLTAHTGATLKELMNRMGQSSMQAALRYMHATKDRDVQIALGLDRFLEEATAGPRPVANVVQLQVGESA